MRAGKNSDANSDDWLNARGVRQRITELMAENANRAQMSREELLTFYAEVIRTPADQVPAGSPVIQAYEQDGEGRVKIRVCDKIAAGAALARMCNWNSAERLEIGVNTLTGYLRELRAQPFGGGSVLPLERAVLPLESGSNGEGSLDD